MTMVARWLTCITALAAIATALHSSPEKRGIRASLPFRVVNTDSPLKRLVRKGRKIIDHAVIDTTVDQSWAQLLEIPPDEILGRVANLTVRSQGLADGIINTSSRAFLKGIPDLDIICAGGGGFKPFYLIGALQVLDAVARKNTNHSPRLHRFMGASGCGQTCFMVVLQGDLSQTLTAQLSYSRIQEMFPTRFGGIMGGLQADHDWQTLGSWLVKRYAQRLSALNNTVYMHVTLVDTPPRDIVVNTYLDAEDARTAFIASGSFGTIFRGKAAVDGGLALQQLEDFPDHRRPRLYVRMNEYETPNMVKGFDIEEAVRAVEGGQNDMFAVLKGYPNKAIFVET